MHGAAFPLGRQYYLMTRVGQRPEFYFPGKVNSYVLRRSFRASTLIELSRFSRVILSTSTLNRTMLGVAAFMNSP